MSGTTARRRNDALLIGGVLAAAAIGLLLWLLLRTRGAAAVVLVDGVETARYSLDTPVDTTLQLDGDGTNRLVIRDGRAYVTAANCPDQICVKHAGISHVGESIVCLPHKLVVRIEGASQDAPDVIA